MNILSLLLTLATTTIDYISSLGSGQFSGLGIAATVGSFIIQATEIIRAILAG
ncbi:MAG: hypothetical protein AAB353_09135 [Candidatus Hydrogenedentota bacterium]